MKVGREGVVLVAWTDTLKCMKPRGDTVDFLQAEIVGTCGTDFSDNIQRHTTSIIFHQLPSKSDDICIHLLFLFPGG